MRTLFLISKMISNYCETEIISFPSFKTNSISEPHDSNTSS